MINKILFKYYFFAIKNKHLKFNFCLINTYKESIVLLETPLVIYDLHQSNTSINKRKLVKDIIFNNIEKSEPQVLIDFSVKDKKNKINTRIDNSEINSDLKKIKIKSKKKQRNKPKLSNKDILFKQSFVSDVIREHDNVNIELTKSVKFNKNRKKYKLNKNHIDSRDQLNLGLDDSLNKNHEFISKEIILDENLTIQKLSEKLGVPEAAIITWLFLQGISVTINQVVDISIATKVADYYNFSIVNNLDSNTFNINVQNFNQFLPKVLDQIVQRPPIITIFGHVNHGKTTLLDSILKTNLTCQEVGKITQSIKGYEIEFEHLHSQKKLVFLDTPGHEAFTSMRLRGAEVTDIALLVVAADDGLKPQSIEAINYILQRKIPYVVAINKIDKANLNLDNIKQQLIDYKMVDKNWGRSSIIIEVSALKNLNIDLLLYSICDLANTQNFHSNPQALAQGTVLDSYLDAKTGTVATLVVQNGTLNTGDIIVASGLYGRVKSIMNSNKIKVRQAFSSTVVDVWGFSLTPQAGSKFQVVCDEKAAKHLANKNQGVAKYYSGTSTLLNARVTLDNYNDKKNLKIINVILKADTQGSIEAVINSCTHISQEKVQINILSTSCGSISNNDIELAIASKSIILGFNISTSSHLNQVAKKYGITIALFDIIYGLLDYINEYMLSFVEPEYDQYLIGKAKVKTVFNINKRVAAGCIVNYGKLKKNATISVYRNQNLLYKGSINSLKHIKDDVEEVLEGNECGIMCNDYQSWQSFDIIEVHELIEKIKVL
nr:translation initiation factor 2 [Calliblepharis sp.]